MALTEAIKDEIRTHVRALHRQPGVVPRRGQNRMIAEIARTLAGESGRRIICVEGPTGTGKSVGYLIPALALARAEERPLIVATATVALQEQLALRDVPLLLRTLGIDLEVTIAKGRGRYVCTRDLLHAGAVDPSQAALDLGMDAAPAVTFERKLEPEERATLGRLVRSWEEGTFSGDLDQWPEALPPVLVRAITTTRHGCSGRACPLYSKCPAQAARRASRDARLVITNHAQLLAELGNETSIALPSLGDAIVVIDEAHHLPAAAVDRFATELPLDLSQRWLRQASTAVSRTFRALPADAVPLTLANDIADAIERLRDHLEDIQGILEHRYRAPVADAAGAPRRPVAGQPEVHVHTFLHGLDTDIRGRAAAASGPSATLAKGLASIRRAWGRAVRTGQAQQATAAAQVAALGPSAERAEQIRLLLEMWASVPDPREPPVACWASRTSGREPRWSAHGVPVDASRMLREQLADVVHGLVLTSATLTTLGSFDHFRRQVGLDDRDGTQYLRLDSPFDLARQGELLVPPRAIDPAASPAVMTRAIADEVLAHPPASGGLLVIFTSKAQLEAVYRALPRDVQVGVERQGQGARPALLKRHAERVERGERAVLFGLNSFAEGLDLVGRLCTHVIATRLPFAVPDNPVERVRKAWLEGRGGNYFAEVAVPACALRLTQICGRLIRSEADQGRITVLDRRLVSTRYGQAIVRTLPQFRFTDATSIAPAA